MPRREDSPSPAMDCSLWKVLPSLPPSCVLQNHAPDDDAAGLFGWRMVRLPKWRSDSVNGMGCYRPSNNCRFARYCRPGSHIPTAKLHRDHCSLFATPLTVTKIIESGKLACPDCLVFNDQLREYQLEGGTARAVGV